jgi:alpha-1,3-mannosyl-glycoprotein beta-1,2-N-acetylglucosaminyltransferase
MIFSPDFLNYFDKTSSLLKNDSSIWCISSWNDVGYNHLVDDPIRMYRTQFFPGLGWMIERKIWDELSPIFPRDLWDEFMRSTQGNHKNLNKKCQKKGLASCQRYPETRTSG